MQRRIAFIYPWATFGGVEKVMLTRAKLLNQSGLYAIDLLFTHDSGAASTIISALSLCDNVEVKIVNLDYLAKKNYSCIFCIDFPAALEYCHEHNLKYYAECHTPYKENREYLNSIKKSCSGILFPSEFFLQEVSTELHQPKCSLAVLHNFIPWDQYSNDNEIPSLPHWTKKPILYLGRMDKLKNPCELLDAFLILKERSNNQHMLVFCGPKSHELDIIQEVKARGLMGDTIILPPIPFVQVDKLFKAISYADGIFVSPSTGESFGLSASEAICSDIPVVLSNIEAHCYLVSNKESEFIYSLHNPAELAEKIEFISSDYNKIRDSLVRLKDKFSSAVFIKVWEDLLKAV